MPAQVVSGAASAAQRAGQSVVALLKNLMVIVSLMFYLLYAGRTPAAASWRSPGTRRSGASSRRSSKT